MNSPFHILNPFGFIGCKANVEYFVGTCFTCIITLGAVSDEGEKYDTSNSNPSHIL